MYKLQFERKTQKKLAKVPIPYYTNIKSAILDLCDNPRPQGYKKLIGRDAFRIRVNDYRVFIKFMMISYV
jgi:mRNA interferase RelE/StbE